jgi:RHS repeat-associated protein
MVDQRVTARRLSNWALLAILGAMLWAAGVRADDFGGPSSSGSNDSPPPTPPCNSCPCAGPGGSGGGDGGGGGPGNSNTPPWAKDGKPISFFNGAEEMTSTDLVVNGVFPILIQRKYDSRSTYDSALGYGWTFMHERRLYEYPDNSVVVRHGCGTRDRYVLSGGAFVTPVGSMLATLSEEPDGTFRLKYLNGATDTFDSQGRLTAVTDARGNRLEYSYDSRGKLPLVGSSKESLTPTQPMTVAYTYRLTRIDARGANGVLTGRYVTFGYDEPTGRLTSVTADDGRTVTYEHDVTQSLTLGNLTQVNGLEGVVSTYAYADPLDPHNVTSITPAQGRTAIVNTYDDQDRVTRQMEGARQMDIVYNVAYTKTTVTKTIRDQNGLNPYTAATVYEFDASGRVTKLTDALGNETRYTYDAAKMTTRKEIWQKDGATLSLLQAKNWTYDANGNKLTESVTLDSGETVTRSWSYEQNWIASEQVVSSAAPSKIFRTEHTFYFGADGRPTNVQSEKRRKDDGSFQTTTYTYDTRNRLLSTTLPDGVQAVNEYTGDYVTRVYFVVAGVAVPNREKRFEYDAAGNRIKEWDARGNLTQYEYDERRRLTALTNALEETTLYTFVDDQLTQIEVGRTVADGEGQLARFVYNARNQLIRMERKDDAGAFVSYKTFESDSEGRRLSVTDPNNRVIRVAYDQRGLVNTYTDATNASTHFEYDAAGNLTKATDPSGGVVRHEYDALNRRTASVDTRVVPNARTEYTYDAAGNVTSVTDAKNQVTSYWYDALSRNTRVTQPLGQFVQYQYNDRNQLDLVLNARGQKVDLDYFAWGEKQAERYYSTVSSPSPSREITFEYDNDGHATSITDTAVGAGPAYAMVFDALGRLTEQTIKYIPGGDRVLRQRYDRIGNRVGSTLLDGGTFDNTYSYNKLNHLISATLAGAQVGITLSSSGSRLVVAYPNGVNDTYAYRANGPIESIAIDGPSGPIASVSYSYDALTNLIGQADQYGAHTFGYDELSRLENTLRPPSAGVPNENFEYDIVGNRQGEGGATTHSYDQNNRLVASGGQTLTWDADGNLVTSAAGATLAHDIRGQLSSFTLSGTTTTYLYDATGRRIRKTVNGVDTWFLWDQTQLLAEYDGSGLRTRRYGYIASDRTPSQVQDVSGTYYIHSDRMGAPFLVTNSTAQVVWRSVMKAFGSATIENDPDGNGVAFVLNFRFPGQYADAESGYHYNLLRTYDPAIGRYIEPDPLGQAGGLNVYLYASDAPQTWVDPLGLIACSEVNQTRQCPEEIIQMNDVKDGPVQREYGDIVTTDMPGIPIFVVVKGELFWVGTVYWTLMHVEWTEWQVWTTHVFKKITCPPFGDCSEPDEYFVDCYQNPRREYVGKDSLTEWTHRFVPSPSTYPLPPTDDDRNRPQPQRPRQPTRR